MKQPILKLLEDRYFLKNEKEWEDLVERVSKIYPNIKDLMLNMKFISSSPTLMNANTGIKNRGTLSSCFTMGVNDSIMEIYDSLKECAIVTKMAGGVGYDWSNIRSKGENIRKLNKPSSGVLPFINIFDATLEGIRQGGARKGAGMSLLDISHPDILDFINAKSNDVSHYRRFNFSVKITDDFYKKLENEPNTVWVVKDILTGKEKPLQDKDGKYITVKNLWDKIVKLAWSSAEPGIFNSDIAYRQCTTTNVDNKVICNPCLTGDTLIAVADGRNKVSIKQLVDDNKDVLIYSLNHDGKLEIKNFMNPRLTQKNADIYEVTFDSGMKIKCTGNHKFLNTDGKMIETLELKKGDSIKNINKHKIKITEANTWMKEKKGQDYYFLENNGKLLSEHRFISEYKLGRKLKKGEVVHHIDKCGLNNNSDNLVVMNSKDHNKLHGKDMIGKKNPIFKVKDDPNWRKQLSENSKGLKNNNVKNISNEEIIKLIKFYTKKTFNNYFTKDMWNILNLPQIGTLSKYRYKKIEEYCNLAKVKYINSSLYKKLDKINKELIDNNYNYVFDDDTKKFFILRKCEYCGKSIVVEYNKRHITFCSKKCLGKYNNKPFMFNEYKFSEKYLKSKKTKNRIKKVYKLFNDYKNGNFINFKKENKLANSQIRPNNPFAPSVNFIKNNINKVNSIEDIIKIAEKNLKNFKDKNELSKSCSGFNHKVISIKYIGKEDVYDGTVGDNHTILVGGNNFINEFGKESTEWVVTGQCSEYVNIPYSSCNLGSMNLTKYVKNKKFDFKEYGEDIIIATNFLNNVIDVNEFPILKIDQVTKKIRPIGLGVMGLAHTLMLMGFSYNSEKALNFTEKVISYTTLKSMETSIFLAKKNEPYPEYNYDLFLKANERFWKKTDVEDININNLLEDLKKYGVRNSCFTSIAPTGSISFIADVSSGIEPVFSLNYIRKIEHEDRQFEEVHITDRFFEDYLDKNHRENKLLILNYVGNNKGSCQGCKYLSEEEQKLFLTAQDLTSIEHLNLLEKVSKNTSLSVSKTINLPNDCSVKDVSNVYLEAYKRNVIGVTVYRDGCREGILVDSKSIENLDSRDKDSIHKTTAPKRPKELKADLHILTVKKLQYYVVVGLFNDEPYEIFTGNNYNDDGDIYISRSTDRYGIIHKEKRGKYTYKSDDGKEFDLTNGHSDSNVDALTRQISIALRHGADISFIVDGLEKTKGDMFSFSKALARTLKKYIPNGSKAHGIECSECGADMIRNEGCLTCIQCGNSKCG
jgi:ribonucleotide reductase alpha subunit